MTAPARIKQDDVTRLMKGARAAGFTRVRLSIDHEGTIVVDASDDAALEHSERGNPLDRVLARR